MSALKKLSLERPYLFVIGLFIITMLTAFPFVVAFKLLGLEMVPLRLIIPAAQSLLLIWLIWRLDWLAVTGFSGTVRDVHVYWYPVMLAFVPAFFAGSIDVDPGWIIFYSAALIFTGISEEALSRGITLSVLMPRGKWVALFFAAAIFSSGHFTNLFFEDFGPLEMFEKLLSTFGFAVLYGGVFIRTGNILPLIVLHAIHDYIFVTSGTAGPFVIEALPLEASIGLSVINIIYGAFIIRHIPPYPPPYAMNNPK